MHASSSFSPFDEIERPMRSVFFFVCLDSCYDVGTYLVECGNDSELFRLRSKLSHSSFFNFELKRRIMNLNWRKYIP